MALTFLYDTLMPRIDRTLLKEKKKMKHHPSRSFPLLTHLHLTLLCVVVNVHVTLIFPFVVRHSENSGSSLTLPVSNSHVLWSFFFFLLLLLFSSHFNIQRPLSSEITAESRPSLDSHWAPTSLPHRMLSSLPASPTNSVLYCHHIHSNSTLKCKACWVIQTRYLHSHYFCPSKYESC